jgi:hypothetical protein
VKIKIISCYNPQSWYADKIGETFETYGDAFEYAEKGNVVYFIKNISGTCFVKKSDAIELK